jgi:hypothetical protein
MAEKQRARRWRWQALNRDCSLSGEYPVNSHDLIETQAKHAEIARRYAWQAQQRRKRGDEKPDPARLITLIRLRELERLFQSRYGRLLPNDDAGMDDLLVAAHHIAFLRGEVIDHIVG